MAGTLFFVHGTGVREEGLEETWSAFVSGAQEHGLDDLTPVKSDWGLVVAPDLSGVSAALPLEAAPDARPPDDENSAAAWSLLVDDPWFELALLAGGEQQAPIYPGARPEDDAANRATALSDLDTSDADELLATAGVTAADLRGAAEIVAASDEFAPAVRKAGSHLDASLVILIARAIVAAVLSVQRAKPPGEQPLIAFDRALRDQVVDLVATAYAPEKPRGAIADYFKKQALGFASRIATNIAVPRRETGMGLAGPFVVDILFYQRRGDDIRDYVARALARCERPIVAVGHSLGGVILVDLLSGSSRPDVDLLVTVGSQAPLFYAIDALEHLRPEPGAEPFEPWINIYSQEDLLSFCAMRVFENAAVLDVEVDAGVPFPESHSAYWSIPTTFETIRRAYDRLREKWSDTS